MLLLEQGDNMKKNFILITFSILAGILVTFFILNKESFAASEEYLAYAFLTTSVDNVMEAENEISRLGLGIYLNNGNKFDICIAIYKDLDIVNEMINQYEKNGTNIYLKTIKVSKNFYKSLDTYENIIKNTNDKQLTTKISESILKMYLESDQND